MPEIKKPFTIGEESIHVNQGNLETKIDESIEKKIKKWALLGAWFLIFTILGYLISTVWDLNGKIYEACGKQAAHTEEITSLKDELRILKAENMKLNNEINENKSRKQSTERGM